MQARDQTKSMHSSIMTIPSTPLPLSIHPLEILTVPSIWPMILVNLFRSWSPLFAHTSKAVLPKLRRARRDSPCMEPMYLQLLGSKAHFARDSSSRLRGTRQLQTEGFTHSQKTSNHVFFDCTQSAIPPSTNAMPIQVSVPR